MGNNTTPMQNALLVFIRIKVLPLLSYKYYSAQPVTEATSDGKVSFLIVLKDSDVNPDEFPVLYWIRIDPENKKIVIGPRGPVKARDDRLIVQMIRDYFIGTDHPNMQLVYYTDPEDS